MNAIESGPSDAYRRILHAIDMGEFNPGDRLVESELADRLGMSRTPVREALQRLETQGVLARDGRSLIVASLNHDQLGELYVVRSVLEGLSARLAAQHAATEEIKILNEMVEADRALMDDPGAMSRANKRFHRQIHLASHNRFLIQQLDSVRRSLALLATTTFASDGRPEIAMREHQEIVDAIAARDGDRADAAARQHISTAYETRLKADSGADGGA
ncbi:MAG: GntR family transcriptional regulator [Pseudomonadota bacterium]